MFFFQLTPFSKNGFKQIGTLSHIINLYGSRSNYMPIHITHSTNKPNADKVSEVSNRSNVREFFFPEAQKLPEDVEMPIWDHLDELRERILLAGAAGIIAVIFSFCFSKELVIFLEAPVIKQGVRFLQLSPGEFFFTTLKVSGYVGLLLSMPTIIYQIGAYIRPGLTTEEKNFIAPIFTGSSLLFLIGIFFSYQVLVPGALTFFVDYAAGAVESLWSIDQYFEFIFVLMLGTGLSFQVPVVQVMLGLTGIVDSEQMFKVWKYIVVGATVLAAFLTPSTDPLTQMLLALPLIGLYLGGAMAVRLLERERKT
jgi:sec-independent protein translocase protein TatC